jgi:hypothetical protein
MFCHENLEQQEIEWLTIKCNCNFHFSTAWVFTSVHRVATLRHQPINILHLGILLYVRTTAGYLIDVKLEQRDQKKFSRVWGI